MKQASLIVAKDDAGKVSTTGGDRNLGIMELKSGGFVGIYVPTIDTAIVYLQASSDGVNFSRLQKADGSADWSVASGAGGKAVAIDFPLPFRFLKIEVSATQTTAAKTFIVSAIE